MIFCGPTERLLEAGKKISPHSDGLPRVNALIDVIENTQELALLEEWEHLYLDSPPATPLQAWSWLYSWWELYGEGYELRLIVVRNYLDALVTDRWEEAVFEPGGGPSGRSTPGA